MRLPAEYLYVHEIGGDQQAPKVHPQPTLGSSKNAKSFAS